MGIQKGSKLPFVEEAGFTVSFPAGLKSTITIGSLAALALNLIIENYITCLFLLATPRDSTD
jgi:hypothetical protein